MMYRPFFLLEEHTSIRAVAAQKNPVWMEPLVGYPAERIGRHRGDREGKRAGWYVVKAMANIMLINVFKEKASRKFSDFKIHCMMDEIGKLHPNNVKGILDL